MQLANALFRYAEMSSTVRSNSESENCLSNCAPNSVSLFRSKGKTQTGGQENVVFLISGDRLAHVLIEKVGIGRHPAVDLGCNPETKVNTVIAGVV
jgi:hypothetical protein